MGLEKRVKIQQLINNQLPSFVIDESPNAVEFLKQYYISQEYQGGPVDLTDNLDQYLKLDNLISEVIVDTAKVTAVVEITDTTIEVSSTKGFPKEYGLVKIGEEIVTYTGKTSTSFTGCIRGFSGISNYHNDLNQEELIFSSSSKEKHEIDTPIENLSSLFLREFFKKFKSTFLPGFEELTFATGLDVGNFIKDANSFYQSKGTEESFKILFNVLFGEDSKLVNLEQYLIKPSSSKYNRKENIIIEILSPSVIKDLDVESLVGKSLFKTTDSNTNAVISSAEPFSRQGKTYYKFGLFVGYGDISTIQGDFKVTPATKNLSAVSITDKVISVDSTIGFPNSGTLVSVGNTAISYTDKSLNQFIGCSNIESSIAINSVITSNETYYAYDNNSNKIVFRILGTIRDFIKTSNSLKVDQNDIIYVNSLGDNVENTTESFKEIFANSWIYNTSSRYQIQEVINDSTFKLKSNIDRSSLKVGDKVDIVEKNGQYLIETNDELVVTSIDETINHVVISGLTNTVSIATTNYDIRKKINYASAGIENLSIASSSIPYIEYGNTIISDIQNLYVDGDSYAYVASNSLPSKSVSGITSTYGYTIDKKINSIQISDSNTSNYLIDGKDTLSGISYTTIVNSTNVPFITGDEVYYEPTGQSLVGLETGRYFIKVIQESGNISNKFKLYHSRAFIDIDEPVGVSTEGIVGVTTHNFSLYGHKNNKILPQKLLRKFPLQKNIKDKSSTTNPGVVGMLINGVEILNYKSEDKIYYGPIDKISVLNGGKDYDVINPPLIEVSSGLSNALIQPVISGEIKDVLIDTQDYDIEKIVSVTISGGNGSDGNIEPVITKRTRQIEFDGRRNSLGGGINTTTDRILCLTDHNLLDGEEVIYNSLGNQNISIGSGTETLSNGSSYFVKVINNKTISLFNTKDDFIADSNQIGFSTGTDGIHRFSTANRKNTISSVNILNGGKYTNRKLKFDQYKNVDEFNDCIKFVGHGFENGDLVEYSGDSGTITGLNASNNYFVLKIDNDSFRLCDAGVGATITSNFDREKYVAISTTSSNIGYQNINYPPVSVSIKYQPVGFGTNTQTYEEIVSTPVIKGEIIDTYLYNKGTGYGTTILNFDKSPLVTIKNGKEASLVPNIINGKVDSVIIEYPGIEYYSVPELNVIDSGTNGSGAKLRAVISDGKITDVKVLNAGIGYSSTSTINVISSGSGAIIQSKIRPLTVNDAKRFENENYLIDDGNLQYTVSGYIQKVYNSFRETPGRLSEIIGWAYDGNPIYGPNGYINPKDATSDVKTLVSSYILDVANVVDRPSGFDDGFFIEDYKFDGSGDLDEYNGRFSITKEFPNGVYAYYATLNENIPTFPYFIGNEYKSTLLDENQTLDQSFDFSDTNILRNTYPYRISDNDSDYEFVPKIDSNKQKVKVDCIGRGEIENLNIISSGDNYKINDLISFESSTIDGGGLSAAVSKLKGKDIQQIDTTIESYDAEISWLNPRQLKFTIVPNHTLIDKDYVYISGISTDEKSKLNTSIRQISVGTSITSSCISTVTSSSSLDTKEIYLSYIPENISIGSSIKIEDEFLRVLGIFKDDNILRVERGSTGVAHSENTPVYFLNDSFIVDFSSEYFSSDVNKKVFFNPQESIGFGVNAGIGSSKEITFGSQTIVKNIPTQVIEIPNHPFVNNQKIKFFAASGGQNISISTDGSASTQTLPEDVYVVNKGRNFIGLKTELTSENSVFFVSCDTNNDLYRFETRNSPITAKVRKNISRVSVSTSHGLSIGDKVELNIQPNLNVGIGTSTKVNLRMHSGRLSSNSFSVSTGSPPNTSARNGVIDINGNTITVVSHELNTGDKLIFGKPSNSAALSPLIDGGGYYVVKVDDDVFKLSETYDDSIKNSPVTINLTSFTGPHIILELANSQVKVVRGNNLVFDTSDSALSGYSLKIYTDKKFENEFVSTGSTSNFNVVSTASSVTIKYDENIPTNLFYNIEKDGIVYKSDVDVKNRNEILYVDSSYNNESSVIAVGAGETYFDLVLTNTPEKLTYNQSECTTLEYSTSSKNAQGPITDVRIISKGNYKKLPKFDTVISTLGKDAYISAESSLVGNINGIDVTSTEFEYPSDITLKPESYISPLITLDNSNTIDSITVLNGGSAYTKEPDLIIVDSITGKRISSGFIKANLSNSSISTVDILENPKGIPDDSVKIIAINNTSGISISKVESNSTGIFTCFITTPTGESGFSVDPFNINGGDLVYIEGIEKDGELGDGFNSEDYGFKFFVTKEYIKQSGANNKVVIDLSDSANSNLSSNTGIAKTTTNIFGTIILKDEYPSFSIIQSRSLFEDGESISVNNIDSDIVITESRESTIKVFGFTDIKVGDILTGKNTGTVATVSKIDKNSGIFSIDYSTPIKSGWDDEIGKLSSDYQKTPDNDYYQNLSYSVKSSVSYEKSKPVVDSILHTSGLKNFADMQIQQVVSGVGVKTDGGSSNESIDLHVLVSETRADSINDFDLVRDIDNTSDKSRFLEFKNKRLSNFAECAGNRVLEIDNLQPLFSNFESETVEFKTLFEISDSVSFDNYIVKITSTDESHQQLSEFVILNDSDDRIIVNRGFVSSDLSDTYDPNTYGIFDIISSDDNKNYLRFYPTDAYNYDYDLKLIRSRFISMGSGIGTTSVGFIDITSSNSIVSTGNSEKLIEFNSNNFESMYANVQIIDSTTNEMNFVELYLTHNGTNTFFAENYFDSTRSQLSSNNIGIFTGGDLSANKFELKYMNNTPNSNTVRAKIVGFGATSVGVGTYRFKSSSQTDGTERSAVYSSNYIHGTGISTLTSFDINLFDSAKSIIEVSIGSTKSVHQVMSVWNSTNSFVKQSAFLSVDNNSDNIFNDISGIGTFGGNINGSNYELRFYPDSEFSTSNIIISSLNQAFYKVFDEDNNPLDLEYGVINENISLSKYNGINADRINRKDFELNSNNISIFVKAFNPSDTLALSTTTGQFSIEDHFFSTGQELKYTPKTSVVNVTPSSMTYYWDGSNINLPSTVFAIKESNDSFYIATTYDNATLGIAATTLGVGVGNTHEFEVLKKEEKVLISIDNIVQYPLINANLVFDLSQSIGTGVTFIPLSGISSIRANDILLIGNEYLKVINVGLGEQVTGPIVGSGSFNLVNVERGILGTSASSHSNSGSNHVNVYRGSFNIEGNTIYFVDAPRGNPELITNNSNAEYETSDFNGRVFLKANYNDNKIFDDISEKFTGSVATGRTFTLTVAGLNTSGIGTEGKNGILFINGVYQSPTTENNPNGNYQIVETEASGGDPGITSIIFSAITIPETLPLTYYSSEYDINQNELPRGGLIVSLGSTPGSGYAPLVGASVTSHIGAGGSFISAGIGTTDITGSGYYGTVAVGVTDLIYDHRFVSSGVNSIFNYNQTTDKYTATNATYDSSTGILVLTIPNHNLTNSNSIGIDTGGIVFSCSKDNYTTEHAYPREVSKTKQRRGESGGDPAHNTELQVISVTSNTISVGVGSGGGAGNGANITATVGVGGTLVFNVGAAGTEYVNPQIFVSPPSYENLTPVGISRIGVGATTDTGDGLLVDVKMEPVSVSTGVGSTLYQVSEFNISRQGFNFRKGDKFTLVGLVTARGLSEPINDFELEVLDVYNDSFASWDFGNLDYIDSILTFQDGERTKFTLRYDGSLLSFEAVEGSDIDFAQILLVFINGILQKPNEAYEFTGGTSITFKTPPKKDDKVNIYFYLGIDGVDVSKDVSVRETIETGDIVQVVNKKYITPSYSQEERTNYFITASDLIETNLYLGEGITQNNEYRPLKWVKQKSDKILNGENISKDRVSLEPLIIPTANIIKNVGVGDTNLIFIDNAESFKYDSLSKFTCTIINPSVGVHHVSEFNSVVGSSGTITEISVSTFDSEPCLKFTLQGAGNALQTGFPIYIFNTEFGVNNQYSNVYGGVTTEDDSGNTIGVGVSFLDNIYYVSAFDSTTGIITCRVNTAGQSAISGISTSGIVGNYSWGYVTNSSKNLSFTNTSDVIVSGMEVNTSEQSVGLSTHPVLMRRTGGFRGGLKRQILS